MYLPIPGETPAKKNRGSRKRAKHKAKQRRRVNGMLGRKLGRRYRGNK